MGKIWLNVGKCKRERGIKRIFKELRMKKVVDTGNHLLGPLFEPMASTPNCHGPCQLRLTRDTPVSRNALRIILSRDWSFRSLSSQRGYGLPSRGSWQLSSDWYGICLQVGQLRGAIYASELPAGSGWGVSSAEPNLCLASAPALPVSLTSLRISPESPSSINHLHKNPCLRLCFYGHWPKTEE